MPAATRNDGPPVGLWQPDDHPVDLTEPKTTARESTRPLRPEPSATFGFCPNRHARSAPPSTRDNAQAPWYMDGTFFHSTAVLYDEAQVRHGV